MYKSSDIVRRIQNRVMGNAPACRNMRVRSSDIFLVSYPRSGNTWLRFMLGKLLHNKPIDFVNMEQVIPDIYKNSNKALGRIENPRIIKSHEYFDSRYKKVIYVYRDGRDVAYSYFNWFLKFRNYERKFDDFLVKFLDGALDEYGAWDLHVKGWLDSAKSRPENVIVISYEKLRENPSLELTRVLEFLKVDRSNAQVLEAIKWAEYERMVKVEGEQSLKSPELSGSRQDIKFVRTGLKNGWRNTYSVRQKNTFNKRMGYYLSELGYDIE